jgi:type I restriction enzyme M protein
MDLIPPNHVIARFFPEEKVELDALIVEQEAASQELEEFIEEHAVEEGLLWEAVEDDKISKALATARLRVAKREDAEAEEIQALQHVIKLYEAESAAKTTIKEVTSKLEAAVLTRYSNLTTEDVQALVIDDKWGWTISSRVGAEVTSLGRSLVSRLHVLAARYATTVGELDAKVEAMNAKVAAHLAAMGIEP